jgi:Family of unknown function (DUF6364)
MAKLTLSIDEKVVARAKAYAARREVSVSRLVERYLDAISLRTPEEPLDTPVLRMLRGAAKGVDPNDYRRHLERKYR